MRWEDEVPRALGGLNKSRRSKELQILLGTLCFPVLPAPRRAKPHPIPPLGSIIRVRLDGVLPSHPFGNSAGLPFLWLPVPGRSRSRRRSTPTWQRGQMCMLSPWKAEREGLLGGAQRLYSPHRHLVTPSWLWHTLDIFENLLHAFAMPLSIEDMLCTKAAHGCFCCVDIMVSGLNQCLSFHIHKLEIKP